MAKKHKKTKHVKSIKITKKRKIAKVKKKAIKPEKIIREPKYPSLPLKDLKFYKGLIIKKLEALLEDAKSITGEVLRKSQRDASGDLSSYSSHLADLASDSYERDFLLGIASDESQQIFELNEALKRIEGKTFGFCISCSKKILVKRLKAIPYTKFCRACQEKIENELKKTKEEAQ